MISIDVSKAIELLRMLHDQPDPNTYTSLVRRRPKTNGQLFKKSELMQVYRDNAGTQQLPAKSARLDQLLRTKPVRSLSGVTPITVLTKPYPCPGKCIFCPVDIRMPKSYLSTEPGAQRADANFFDPYLQVYSRLEAFREMGHPYQKVELIVLGGTWSVYPLTYRLWFIKRLFDALNDFGLNLDHRSKVKPLLKNKLLPLKNLTKSSAKMTLPQKNQNYNQSVTKHYDLNISKAESASWADLTKSHLRNETNPVRCVGLVLETRPDYVTPAEVLCLRRLGATKIQLGIQSLNDRVLKLNKRGHTVAQAETAISLLRLAGFKLHLHWMPNLYGANVQSDLADYKKLFKLISIRPDELKIYPCSLIPGTELMTHYKSGAWQPYSNEKLSQVLSGCLQLTPRYCRISRMVRDIGSQDIVAGNKQTNFRQVVQNKLAGGGGVMQDIRAREIRGQIIDLSKLKLKKTRYLTSVSTEYFLEYVTPTDHIAAFLRLSLPVEPINRLTDELSRSALIREVHVYGQAMDLDHRPGEHAQHTGLGKQLIASACLIAKKRRFTRISVISAVGTREYYRKLGFQDGELYQHYTH